MARVRVAVRLVIIAALAAAIAAGGALAGCAKPKPAPVLLSVEPADGATDVDRAVVIKLGFDQPMDPMAGTQATIEPPLPGGWYVEGDNIVFDPVEPLGAGLTYRVTLKAGALSRDGVPSNSSGVWSFSVRPPVGGHTPALAVLDPIEAFPGVRAIAFGRDGELYGASDTEVRVLGAGGGSFQPYSSGWTSIEDVDVDPLGRVWLLLAEKDNYRAVRLAQSSPTGDASGGSSGATSDLVVPIPQPTYPAGQWNWFYPKCLTVLADGDLLVLGTDRVMRLGQGGAVKAELGVGTLGGSCTEFYIGPAGMVLDGETLYVENGKGSADTRGIVALGLDGSDARVYRFGIGRRDGLARDEWGNFYSVCRDAAELTHLDVFGPQGDSLEGLLPESEANLDPQAAPGELLIRDGVLYVAGGAEGKILRFSIK